nr:MAG TPA: SPBC3B9.21 protein, SPAC19A8.12 protein [Caudoviricetes sp.]
MMDYFSMYGDVWKFHKKYIDGVKTDGTALWEQIANEADSLTTKYDRCRFIVNLVMTELEEFERLYRE